MRGRGPTDDFTEIELEFLRKLIRRMGCLAEIELEFLRKLIRLMECY